MGGKLTGLTAGGDVDRFWGGTRVVPVGTTRSIHHLVKAGYSHFWIYAIHFFSGFP